MYKGKSKGQTYNLVSNFRRISLSIKGERRKEKGESNEKEKSRVILFLGILLLSPALETAA
jgi:hypothetical protein